VSLDWFFKLKEFDSLSKMRINHLKAMKEQENRLSTLNDKRQTNVLQTEKLQHDAHALQHELFEIDKKMAESETQKKRIIDSGGSADEIATYESKIQELESLYFEKLSNQEQFDQEKADLKQFLTGLDKTISEIKLEVDEEILKEQKQVEQCDLRIKLLLEELPADYKNILEKTMARKLAVGNFTRVDKATCYFCKSNLSKMEESEIDLQHLLKTCKMCHRIFLPFGS
jgi:predicted  nucleic acid-binding Zn-ribbon protein